MLPGNVTDVERVGETVRRAMRPWAQRVHGVLLHLESVGFDGAPRFLAVEGDREVLTFAPGWVPTYEEKGAVTVAALRSAAALLRAMDDALDRLPLPEGADPSLRWRHGDASIGNCVFEGERAVSFIDFDYVRPLPPWWDLHRFAWQSVPLADDDACAAMGTSPSDVDARLTAVIDGYRPAVAAVEQFAERAAQCAQDLIDTWQGDDVVPRIVERQVAWIMSNAARLNEVVAAAAPR